MVVHVTWAAGATRQQELMPGMLCFRCEAAAGAICQEGHRRVPVVAAHPCPHGSELPGHPLFSFSTCTKGHTTGMDGFAPVVSTCFEYTFYSWRQHIWRVRFFIFVQIWCSLTKLYNFFDLCLR